MSSPPFRPADCVSRTLVLARAASSEALRQPAHCLIVFATLLAYALSPFLAMFTLGDDLSLLKDFGASTLLLAGLLLVATGVTGAVGRELETGTARTLLSKPVGRGVFLSGKLLGVLMAVTSSLWLFLIALLFAARVGPPESVRDTADGPAIACALAASLLAVAAGARSSLRTGQPFGAATLSAARLTLTAGFLAAELFDRDWTWKPLARGIDPVLIEAALLSALGVYLLGAVSLLFSTCLRRGALLPTILVFFLGLALGGGGLSLASLLPDLQLFWVGEIFYKPGGSIPVLYLARAAAYAGCYSAACLAASVWVYERREG